MKKSFLWTVVAALASIATGIAVLGPNQTLGMVRQAPATAAAGSIEVIVQNSDGTPVDGVDVLLTGYPYSTSTELTMDQTTEASGRATFRGLVPGSYKVRAARKGYFALDFAGDMQAAATADVAIGDAPWPLVNRSASNPFNQTIRLRLVPQAIITGTIRDANGSSLSGASVTLMKALYFYGHKFFYAIGSFETDDRGEYRMFGLVSGEYYLRIDITGGADRDEATNYVTRTYYPGTNDARDAMPVAVKEGQEAAGINFAMKPAQRGVTLSGTVINRSIGKPQTDGPSSSPVQVILISTREGLAEPMVLNARISGERNGTEFPFEIRHVPPGEYNLYAAFIDRTVTDSFSRSQLQSFSGRTKIEVGDKDSVGLEVIIGKGADIHGHFFFHGVDSLEPPPHIRTYSGGNSIVFQSLAQNLPRFDSLRQIFPGSMEDDDTFTIPDLIEGRYQLAEMADVSVVYGDSYLEDIRQNGRSIYNDGIVTVDTSNVELELVVNRNGGRIRGSIDLPRKDLPGRQGSVVLVPDAPYRSNLALYKYGFFDGAGTFTFGGVAPGNYKIFAFAILERGAEQNAEFIARYENYGIPVTSAAGIETEVLRVPVIRSP